MADADLLEAGFADPVFNAQAIFRAVMDSLANPGTRQILHGLPPTHSPLLPALAAIALALCDEDTPVWLDPTLRAASGIVAWFDFHIASPIVEAPADAGFLIVTAASLLPRLADLAQGTDAYPDRSATVILALPSFDGGPVLTLAGPGIRDRATLAALGLPEDFASQWTANRSRFPRGVDLLLVSGDAVIGLPRTTRIATGAS